MKTYINCPICMAEVEIEKGLEPKDALDWHSAIEHDGMEIVEIKADPEEKGGKHQPKAETVVKPAPEQEIIIPENPEKEPVVKETKPLYTCKCGKEYRLERYFKAHVEKCVANPVADHKPEPEPAVVNTNVSLEDLRTTLKSMAADFQAKAANAAIQAEDDRAFWREIRETEELIEGITHDVLPTMNSVPEIYRDLDAIETMNGKLAKAITQLAALRADPRYIRANKAEKEIALLENIQHAQREAAKHNASLKQDISQDAQDWLDSETIRIKEMVNGDLMVPTTSKRFIVHNAGCPGADNCTCGSKHGQMPFMLDLLWRVQFNVKRLAVELHKNEPDYEYNTGREMTPENIRAVWDATFDSQMKRYGFVAEKEFRTTGKVAEVDPTGKIRLGKNEPVVVTVAFPWDMWSDKLLGYVLKMQKVIRGGNVMETLQQFGFVNKKLGFAELPLLDKSYWTFLKPKKAKVTMNTTTVAAALIAAGITK